MNRVLGLQCLIFGSVLIILNLLKGRPNQFILTDNLERTHPKAKNKFGGSNEPIELVGGSRTGVPDSVIFGDFGQIRTGGGYSEPKCLLVPIHSERDLEVDVAVSIEKTINEMAPGELRTLST